MGEKRKKSNRITIYMIKEDVDYNSVLKGYAYKNILRSDENSVTYFYPTVQNRPEWLTSYFKVSDSNNICNANAKVISLHRLVLDGKERIFAIPFGNGKSLLNDDVIEEQFGIKTLLNSVPKNGFRQLCSSNYGGDHRTRNEQVPKKTDISEFGFDIYSDFLRRATAKSEEELFNKNTITGGDLLSVSVPVTIDNINDFLIKCYERYKSDKYKENFSWLDNIKEVKDKSLKLKLNNELLLNINNRNIDRVWMAVPEVIDWEDVSEFKYNSSLSGFDDVDIEQIYCLFKDGFILNIDSLKSKKVYAIPTDGGEPIYEWSLYNCLIAEIEYEDSAYCLNYGRWYKVNHDFVGDINNYYKSIEISDIEFPFGVGEKEDEYNKKLCDSLSNSILMDKETVRVKGMGKSSIEVCDVLTEKKELIHVKKNGGSSYLSHLFNQAAVSGEMLLDSSFRNEANKKMKKDLFCDDFNANQYTIILAIITKYTDERPKIPFFSKVSIQYAVDGLVRKGYNVKIKNIYNKNV